MTADKNPSAKTSSWRVLLPFAALLFVALAIVAGLGWQQEALREWFIRGTTREDTTASVSVSLSVEDDGRIVASDGTEVGRVAETQVTFDNTFTCTISIPALALERMIAESTGKFEIVSGGRAEITPWEQEVNGVMTPGVLCTAWTGSIGDPFDEEFVPAGEDGIVDLPIILEVTGYYIDRETSHAPTSPRDDSPAYAAEVDAADELTMGTSTTINVTVGPAFATVTPSNPISTAFSAFFSTMGPWHTSFLAVDAECPMVFYEIRDCKTLGGDLNFGEMVVESTGDGPYLQFVGEGTGFDVVLQQEVHSFAGTEAQAYPGHNVDFSAFGVWDRDGNLLPDLLCWGGFVKSALYPVTEKAGYAYGAEVPLTVSEIRGLGAWSQKVGNNSWTTNGEDDKWRLWSNPMQFTIDEDSAKDHGLNPDDLTIELRVPPLSATSCDAEPDVSGIATLSFNDGLGIYGPADGGERALDHDDWAPGENTTRPNLSGGFEVSGGKGALTLAMPNNFGSRLLAVPQQNFPDGMPGWPLQYLFHEAGIYRIHDGRTCPDGSTHSEPLEARYCWRGVPCIDVGLSVPSPTNDPIMATVKCRTWSITDTHVTDSTRQEDAEATPTYHEWTYVVRHVNEANYIYLGTPEEGGGEPDLEDVYEIALTNIPGGEHTIEEPTFARDPLSSEDMTLKIFESPLDNYEHGGFSARVDHVCHYALMDSHETNGGHSTKIEPTVRMWDHLHSPPTAQMPVDITTAFGRGSIVSLLDQVTEAFSCVGSDAIFDSHYKDADDNYMTSGYAFDFCYPLDAEKPLEQPVGDINFACRAGSWTIVAGPEYAVYADKIVEGSMHGPMLDSDGNLARSSSGEKVWRYEDGVWVLHDEPTSDAAGYYVAVSGEVYDTTPALYDYGTGASADDVTNTGRWATREYDFADLFFQVVVSEDAWLLYLPESRMLFFFYTDGENIHHIYSQPEDQYWVDATLVDVPGGTNPKFDVAGACPAAYRDIRHGEIVLAYVATRGDDPYSVTGEVQVCRSTNMGETWGDPVTVDLGLNVSRQMVWQDEDNGLSHLVVVTSGGSLYHAVSDDHFATLLEDATEITSGANSDAQATGYTQRGSGGHGSLYVGLVEPDGTKKQFRSEDLGKTWSEVA